MADRRGPPVPGPLRRAETWLWLGPLGHLAGGALDIGQALARHVVLPRVLALTRGRGKTGRSV